MTEVLLKELDHPADMSQEDIRRFAEAWRPYAPGWSAASDSDYLAFFTNNVIGELAEQNGVCYEIYETGDLDDPVSVGFMSSVPEAHQLTIDILVIKKEYQRRGLGRAALIATAEIAEQEYISDIRLHPLESAIGFYEQLGFVMVPDPDSVSVMMARTDDVLSVRDMSVA